MSKKFKKGFVQNGVKVSFIKLGTQKYVLKQGIEVKITAPKPKKETK